MLSETDYEKLALPELKRLILALDAAETAGLEAELQADILTLEFQSGARFVVNSHRAARQIWLAAHRQAWHFDWVPEKSVWISVKTNDELWATLEQLLSKELGRPLTLQRPSAAS